MIRSRMLLLLALLLGVSSVSCGGSKSKSRKEPAARTAPTHDDTRTGTGPARQTPRPARPRAQAPRPSATTLPICDEYLKRLCACAAEKKAEELRVACKEAKQSAPKWKETSAQDPDQRAVVQASCQKALSFIESNYGCKKK